MYWDERKELIGDILRHQSFLAIVIEGKLEGKSSVRRPPLEYLKVVNETTCEQMKRKAANQPTGLQFKLMMSSKRQLTLYI